MEALLVLNLNLRVDLVWRSASFQVDIRRRRRDFSFYNFIEKG